MFRLRRARKVDALEAELAGEILSSLLDRSSSTVKAMLDRFHDDEVALERDIADLTERLRQTRVAISAFEGAGRVLDDGNHAPIAADPDKVGRLVSRGRGSLRAMQEADFVVDGGRVVKSRDAELPISMVHKDIRA
ncbi:hypothetical protein X739_00825 [Mesorhizobium sp. LNHC220B00]|nr:hypothetical protein [Mesorhizobium sp. LNHC220B00]ESY89066.1 hypothetical protein X739_00825 [Mesorhizobium sp. LNHC220B00]